MKRSAATLRLMRPLANKSVVDTIIDRLTNAIIARELTPGEKIPTEIELADSMKVGRNSVREAIKVLVTMGVLVIKRSEGTFVTEGFTDRMLDPLVYGLILESGDSKDILELRKLIETGVFRYALAKRTDEDLDLLRQAYDTMERQTQDKTNTDALLETDIVFHRIIYAMVRNQLVDKINAVMERLTLPSRKNTLERLVKNNQEHAFLAKHAEMFRAIKEQDASAVEHVLNDHFDQWNE